MLMIAKDIFIILLMNSKSHSRICLCVLVHVTKYLLNFNNTFILYIKRICWVPFETITSFSLKIFLHIARSFFSSFENVK